MGKLSFLQELISRLRGAGKSGYSPDQGVASVEQLERELEREKYRTNYRKALRNTIQSLIVIAALSVLVATLLLPVLKVYGNSMSPTLVEGDIVLSVKSERFETGDVVAFYYNNRILVKRVIAGSGQWVNMDKLGSVSVNDELLNEPYLKERSYGNCDIKLPYQVPDGTWFVMGDHRDVSIDSRHSSVGCVSSDQMVGKLTFCLWPLEHFGPIR